MTAKEFLMQAWKIDDRIDERIDERERLLHLDNYPYPHPLLLRRLR